MSVQPVTPFEFLSLAEQAVVLDATSRFEQAWLDLASQPNHQPPQIEAFLRRLEDAGESRAARQAALYQLILLDVEYRIDQGEQPGVTEYQTRFAEEGFLVDHCFRNLQQSQCESPFQIVRQLAEGGLGKVSVARDRALGREVAYKELREQHSQDPGKLARFQREAEITGRLQHPGIVTIYGLQRGSDGKPSYVMPLIRGEDLATAVRRFHDLPPQQHVLRERSLEFRKLLGSFVSVCRAIAFAHQKGIIHRDLKPQNIMLGEFGESIIVDWGLAKQIDEEPGSGKLDASPGASHVDTVSLATTPTQTGDVLGTPVFMSPEQAGGSSDLVGPRSDIYGLGSTLYFLLTGRYPFSGDEPRAILAQVCRGAFPSPRSVRPGVSKPLEAICLRCMALRPEDRYATALEVADDVERWLGGEATSAYAEPPLVRLGRWSRRHATLVTTAVAVALLAAIGSATMTVLLGIKNRELVTARSDAETRRIAAESAQQAAEKHLSQVKRSTQLLFGVFRDLDPDVETVEGRPLRAVLGERLLAAANELRADAVADPLAVADLQNTLGRSLYALGHFQAAISVLTQAQQTCQQHLSANHLDLVVINDNLATAYQDGGDLSSAVPLFEWCLKQRQDQLGSEHELTLTSMINLAEAYLAAGNAEQALPLLKLSFERGRDQLGDDHVITASARNSLAEIYKSAGDFGQALPLLERVLDHRRRVFGEDHPRTLTAINNLALAWLTAGDANKALTMFALCVEKRRDKLGRKHPDYLTALNNWALAHQMAGKVKESVPLYEECYAQREKDLGYDHPDTINSLNNLAMALQMSGQASRAILMLTKCLERGREVRGADHPDTLTTLNNLATTFQSVAQFDKALELHAECWKLRQNKFGDQHPQTLESLNNLGGTYLRAGKLQEALPLLERCLDDSRSLYGDTHPRVISTMSNLAHAYVATQQAPKALALLEKVLKHRQASLGESHAAALAAMHTLADAYRRSKEFAKAEGVIRQCLDIQQQRQPDDWTAFSTRAKLGLILADQDRFDEAEPLVVAGFDGLVAAEEKANLPPDQPRMSQDLAQQVAQMYEKWGKSEEVARWQSRTQGKARTP